MYKKRIDEELSKLISYDTLGILHLISGWTNKSGILIYNNNKPISSFNKLRTKLNIGKNKWTRIKNEITENDIICESRFIAFGDILKDKMTLDEYILMCRKFDIIPEYTKEEGKI